MPRLGGIKVDLRRKITSMHLQFIRAGRYGCSYAPVFLYLVRLANPLLKYANVCGPPDLSAVAHRLRTSVLVPEHMKFVKVGKLGTGLCFSQKSLFSVNAILKKSDFIGDVINLHLTFGFDVIINDAKFSCLYIQWFLKK